MVKSKGQVEQIQEEFNFTETEVRANFSAILSVITEQEALIAGLLAILVEKGILRSPELTKITDVYLSHETLPPIYQNIYQRYSHHFLRAKQVLENTAKQDLENIMNKELDNG